MKTARRRNYTPAFDYPRSISRVLIGSILLVGGIGWLLDASGIIEFPTAALGPVALIVVGLALIASARRRHNGGLIALGIILTLVLTSASATEARLADGLGERTERPTGAEELQSPYRLGVGSFFLDLSHLDLSSDALYVNARVGLGQISVVVPADAGVVIDARTGAGEIVVFGRQVSAGLGARVADLREPGTSDQKLFLDLRVGMGPIRVSRGTA